MNFKKINKHHKLLQKHKSHHEEKELFKALATKLVAYAFNLLNKVSPKFRKRVVIVAFPDFDDQTRSIVDQNEGKEIILLLDNDQFTRPAWLNDGVKLVKRKSLYGIVCLVTADTILFTHGLFRFFKLLEPKRQLVINITHGMYIKNMHLLDGQAAAPKSHYILCTSTLFQQILAKMFGVHKEKVLVEGLPRNEMLVRKPDNRTLNELQEMYANVHVWLPTYRKSSKGDVRVDVDTENALGSDEIDVSRLNKILNSNNDILLVKPHPMAKYSIPKDGYSNIKFISNDWLSKNGATLYELLAVSNSLWTDYSSVFIDYMVTGKPMLFVMFDMEDYKKSRGLTIDFSKCGLPGLLIEKPEDFYREVSKIDYVSRYDLKPYVDNGVCENIFELISRTMANRS